MLSGIRSRLITLISIYLFVVIVAVTYMIYNFYSGELMERSELFFQESSDDVAEKIDNMFDEMDTISTQLLSSENLQNMFFQANNEKYRNINYFEQDISRSKAAHDILWSINSPKFRIENISIFNNSSYIGLRFSPDRETIYNNYTQDIWNRENKKSYGILKPHTSFWDFVNRELVVSLYRPYIATSFGFMNVGIIEIEESYRKISDICIHAIKDLGTEVIIYNSVNDQIYPQEQVSEDFIETLMGKSRSENSVVTYKNSEYRVSYSNLEWADWTVAILQPEKYFIEPLKLFLNRLITVITVIALIILGLLILVVNTVTKPVYALIREIDCFELDNKIKKLNRYSVKEALHLQSAFIRLVNRLKESVDLLILANETELNLRIMNLQAKINPHFLFNSLTAISSVAMEEESIRVPVMCSQLSDLFRYTSRTENEQDTTLDDEIENIKLYMDFMQWRYEKDFNFEIKTDGDLKQHFVPKLILQPLVENSFTHGFKNSLPPYKIDVSVSSYETSWNFRFRDNGCGFSDEALEKIKNEIDIVDTIFKEQKNYKMLKANDKAIINIYIRLKLQYRTNIKMIISNNIKLGGAELEILVDKKLYKRGN